MNPPRAGACAAGTTARVMTVGATLLLLWSVALLRPAWGHAGGMPTHATLSADGEVVHVELISAADDAALIGSSLGLLPEGAMEWYLGASDEGEPSEAQIRTFSASAELRAYLLDHVEIHQDGHRCDGQAEPAEDFVLEGAELRFTCPAPVEQVDVSITLLHDQDPDYRAYTVDGTIQSNTHTATQPQHRWDFTLARSTSTGVPVGLWAGLAAVVVTGVALVLGVGRRSATSAGRR